MPHFIALTCEALARPIYALAAESANTVSVRLFKQGLHNRPKGLRATLQEAIDAIGPGECDAILLVYGLCGMATAGLAARHTPLVIPRAHDCITLFLGSRGRYQEEFEKAPGTYWYTVDYIERMQGEGAVTLGAAGIEATEEQYEKYVAKYGQETADKLIEAMRRWMQHYTRAAVIDTGFGNVDRIAQIAREKAEREGWQFERLEGNRRLLHKLINRQWDDDEFLVVPPGHVIKASYGDEIVRVETAAEMP
jgi:hypothetical protein